MKKLLFLIIFAVFVLPSCAAPHGSASANKNGGKFKTDIFSVKFP